MNASITNVSIYNGLPGRYTAGLVGGLLAVTILPHVPRWYRLVTVRSSRHEGVGPVPAWFS